MSLKDLAVETKFGTLNVPVANIRSFTPGLSSHQALAKQIAGWIEDLGSGTFNDREAAQEGLKKLGPAIRMELERRRDDADAERRTRVRAILSDFEAAQDDIDDVGSNRAGSGNTPYIQDDTVVTSEFTIVGRIVPQSFAVSSTYGPLTIKLSDIRQVERGGQTKEELPTSFTVTSAHMIHNGMLNTTIHLERGDMVSDFGQRHDHHDPLGQPGDEHSRRGEQLRLVFEPPDSGRRADRPASEPTARTISRSAAATRSPPRNPVCFSSPSPCAPSKPATNSPATTR